VLRFVINFILLFASALIVAACFHEQEIPVRVNFDYVAPESFTAPVDITLQNETTGADFYRWTFEGGSPTASEKKDPGVITYAKPGEYKITLEAWNDTQHSSKEIIIKLDSAVTLDFDVTIAVNDFAPATVEIANHTDGASSYEWTFEDGSPASSALADPPPIIFTTPGEHDITLKVSNGREFFSSTKTIIVKEPLVPAFDIIPSFEDEDYEAPLTATLTNKTVSGLHYTWSSDGGVIDNASDENTSIYFSEAGDYTVTLQASNDKETKSVEHTISVKANSNLYSMNDVKLGVSAAHSTIGCFYSPALRTTIVRNDVDADNGKLIDLVFYGINSTFEYCRFISPDSASKFTFPAIPQAVHTYFVNTIETSSIVFTASDFDAMVDDNPFISMDVKSEDTGIAFFSKNETNRIVLFETHDGRKGAIKIKTFVADGTQSYILADIKLQKLKR
jgi:PKD repeat protein